MDTESILPASALFSPSKARQQRALAQDWAHVDAWLSSRCAGRIPPFERNEDTLRELLVLIAANERADEEEELVLRVIKAAEKEVDGEVKNGEVDGDTQVLHVVEDALSAEGKESLDVLASLAVALDASDFSPETLAHDLLSLTSTSHTLSQHFARLEGLQINLANEIHTIQSLIKEVQGPEFQPPPNTQRQTQEWARSTKHLRTKLAEYSERLAGLNHSASTKADQPSLGRLVEQETAVDSLKTRIRKLEEKAEVFENLPPDLVKARKEVGRAVEELEALKARRDRLFEGLVEL